MSAISPAIQIRSLSSKKEHLLLLASIILQLFVGGLFGHVYDMRINMATGYLVATGQNPYIPQDLTAIFHNPAFQGMTSIGYPPPWPLLLGLIYRLTYAIVPNLLLYNLAIKLPIIAANLGLAYLVRKILIQNNADHIAANKAWIFTLFNPFLLYFTTAWGQFDSLVALITLLALVFLYDHKAGSASLLLALAISLKPISIPIILVAAVYLWGKPWLRLLRFLLGFSIWVVIFCIAPFLLLKWDASPILLHWNAIFTVSGGMSITTIYELLKNTYLLPGMWWLLGFLWLPAIVLSAVWIKPGKDNFADLLKYSLALILIFFLARTWLSEPNLTLILPIMVILVALGKLPKLALTITWILPFIFTIFNTSPPQLLFPILPELMTKILQWMDVHRTTRLIARMISVLPWQLAGWWIVSKSVRKSTPISP